MKKLIIILFITITAICYAQPKLDPVKVITEVELFKQTKIVELKEIKNTYIWTISETNWNVMSFNQQTNAYVYLKEYSKLKGKKFKGIYSNNGKLAIKKQVSSNLKN